MNLCLQLEDGFCGFDRYLVGSWKRTLQWREFGGAFAHLRTSNTIVVVSCACCVPVRLTYRVQIEEHAANDSQARCARPSHCCQLLPSPRTNTASEAGIWPLAPHLSCAQRHERCSAWCRCLKWSFGRSLDPAQQLFGFVMRVSLFVIAPCASSAVVSCGCG